MKRNSVTSDIQFFDTNDKASEEPIMILEVGVSQELGLFHIIANLIALRRNCEIRVQQGYSTCITTRRRLLLLGCFVIRGSDWRISW